MASEQATWDGEGFAATDDAAGQRTDELAQDTSAAGAAQDENDADDGADYDPESVSFDATPQVPDKAASATPSQRAPSAKPKMSGGFLVEVSDDEDDDDSQDSPAGALQTQAQAAPVGNGVSPVAPVDAPSSTPQFVPTLDPVALLEARIKEDPRGDMDAWLNLVADHKRRGRLDDLRKVYNRFVEVFPQAVSACSIASLR